MMPAWRSHWLELVEHGGTLVEHVPSSQNFELREAQTVTLNQKAQTTKFQHYCFSLARALYFFVGHGEGRYHEDYQELWSRVVGTIMVGNSRWR
jgi:hypothetical protein